MLSVHSYKIIMMLIIINKKQLGLMLTETLRKLNDHGLSFEFLYEICDNVSTLTV